MSVEVLDNSTLLLRLEPEALQQGETNDDSLMLGLFLAFLSRQCTANITAWLCSTQASWASASVMAGSEGPDLQGKWGGSQRTGALPW